MIWKQWKEVELARVKIRQLIVEIEIDSESN